MAVSVKRYIHDEPLLFKATVDFVQMFATLKDPVLATACKCESANGRIAWTLLGTALFQELSYPDCSCLLKCLFESFPEEMLWTLPVPKTADLETCVKRALENKSWSLSEHAAGIFWSVGQFVRRHENLEEWIRCRTAEELWRDLGEIYFMGKGNPRPKACAAIYRLTSPAPLGLGFACAPSPKKPHLPLTMGGRRFLSILGPAKESDAVNGSFAELKPAQKQKMANDFYAAVAEAGNLSTPYAAAHSFQYFLEEGKDGFICRQFTHRCGQCPLYKFCPYAEQQRK